MSNSSSGRKPRRVEQTPHQDKARGRNGKRATSGPKIALIVIIVVAVIVVLAAASLANKSSAPLTINKGDRLQFMIEGYTPQGNTTGSLIIEVTNATTTSFEVTYTITLQNQTTRTPVDFSGASGNWAANIGGVMDKLSGSSKTPNVSNETTLYTVYGARSAIGYTITTTTQSGTGLYYEYWLDSTNKCPYLAVQQYADGVANTFTLLYTNILDFQT
jgi:hypothetical protein